MFDVFVVDLAAARVRAGGAIIPRLTEAIWRREAGLRAIASLALPALAGARQVRAVAERSLGTRRLVDARAVGTIVTLRALEQHVRRHAIAPEAFSTGPARVGIFDRRVLSRDTSPRLARAARALVAAGARAKIAVVPIRVRPVAEGIHPAEARSGRGRAMLT